MVFPVVSPDLWKQIVHRFAPATVPYMRKLGVACKKNTKIARKQASMPLAKEITTIDNFFAVATSSPHVKEEDRDVITFVSLKKSCLQDVVLLFENRCMQCQSILINDHRYGQVVCPSCGFCTNSIAFQGNQDCFVLNASVMVPRRVTTYMYKRTNHFLDHIKRFQAKETSSLHQNVLDAVENELRKERIFRGDPRVTTTKIRSILKKLRLQKYYNHVFSITAYISGKSPPSLTPLQEEKLLSMFQEIQEPFQRHCPPERTNMISYAYVLRKLSEILGWTQLMDYFPLLKSRQKVYAQDCIWKKICDDVGYPFFRSIA